MSAIIWYVCSADLLHLLSYSPGPPTLLQMPRFHSFSWLSNIPSVYMFHLFLTHSSVDGLLGVFQDLASVNSAAVNIGLQVSNGEHPHIECLGFPCIVFLRSRPQ